MASDRPEFSTPLAPTCDFRYLRRHLRRHGPGALYASSYGDDALLAGLAQLRAHSAAPTDSAYVFFNNDLHGHAPHDAVRMMAPLASMPSI